MAGGMNIKKFAGKNVVRGKRLNFVNGFEIYFASNLYFELWIFPLLKGFP